MNPNNPNNHQEENAPDLDQELLKRRAKEFEKELVALQEKHGMYIVPIQHITTFGTMLDVIYMTKEEMERRQKLAQEGQKAG